MKTKNQAIYSIIGSLSALVSGYYDIRLVPPCYFTAWQAVFPRSLVDIMTFAFYHHAICSIVGSLSLIVSGYYDIRLKKKAICKSNR